MRGLCFSFLGTELELNCSIYSFEENSMSVHSVHGYIKCG